LQDGIAPQFPDATERLKPLIDQARQLQSEIEDLLQITSTNRMRLNFEVEFYASKANREGLMTGIATGIKNQIQKVEKPIEYFDRRFRALAAVAAQTASDFLDANVDLKRSDARIQGLLQDVLTATSLEQIAPAPNDEFRASEHAVVQVTPRPGGAGGAPSVARLVSRGFRQGSQIVRKASVILYE
jgi:molecular chaperone GrpE (heat shock protein)